MYNRHILQFGRLWHGKIGGLVGSCHFSDRSISERYFKFQWFASWMLIRLSRIAGGTV